MALFCSQTQSQKTLWTGGISSQWRMQTNGKRQLRESDLWWWCFDGAVWVNFKWTSCLVFCLRVISWTVSVGSRRKTFLRSLWTWWGQKCFFMLHSVTTPSGHLCDLNDHKLLNISDLVGVEACHVKLWHDWFCSLHFSCCRVQSLNQTAGKVSPQRTTVIYFPTSSFDSAW